MIDVERGPKVWTVRLNRPDKANSLTKAMLTQLRDVFLAATMADTPALILTGSGKVFSAGADIDEARAGLATDGIWEEVSTAVESFPGLSVAALNGTLAGGAFGMVLACDLRICVPEARFFYPVMKLGFKPQPSDPMRMARLIGPARTKMILMAGSKISASEALTYGLVDRIVEKAELENTVHELLEHVKEAKAGLSREIKTMCTPWD